MEVEKTLETAYGRFLLRPYRDEDEEKVIELWEAAFKQTVNRKIWRWKFHDNPFGRQIMLCLTESGMPIAMYAGIPYIANWNGQQIRMTQLIDNMSHPDFRQATNGRKGLFIQTADFFFEVFHGIHASELIYGFPGQKHFRLGKIFLDYDVIGEGGIFLETAPSQIKKQYLFTLRSIGIPANFDESFDTLWYEAKVNYPLSVCRDSRFLNWRFTQHPVNKYRIYTLKNWKGKPDAYLVLFMDHEMATIVDIFAKKDLTTAGTLIYKVARELSKAGIEKMRIWLPKNHFLSSQLLQCGFREFQEPLGIIPGFIHFDDSGASKIPVENLYYTMADGDLF
jgi:hypothetical protein